VVANAMKFVGYRYVFGGTSPAGFDCSGFVYYIHNRSGAPVGRGMWQQYNGGAHVSMSALQPGDTVFFANTYEPGLSHDGIYIGGGQFVHASDERTGVTVSSLYTGYWQAHYVGATRLW
jgi:cell wall-associated NlpC family hydrolase